MTPEDVAIVQSSFAKVVPISDEAGRMFYGRLFNTAPDVRPLFRGDLDEQSRKLMQMLATVVGGLSDLEKIIPAAQKLAVRHVDYGVTAAQYEPVGEALIWTLSEGLGDQFDADTEAAWRRAYAALSGVMIEVAYEPSATSNQEEA
ncbi:MAG: globin family protein [Pseudomonadota bacterium]